MKKKLVVLIAALASVVFLANPPKAHAFCGGPNQNLDQCLSICACGYDTCNGGHPSQDDSGSCFGDWYACHNDCVNWYG